VWCAVFLNTWSITCLVCLLFSIHQNPETSLAQRHEGSICVRYLYDSFYLQHKSCFRWVSLNLKLIMFVTDMFWCQP
jgi:hypothetical protein